MSIKTARTGFTTSQRTHHLCEGLGIDDPELREKVGEDKITLFQRFDQED